MSESADPSRHQQLERQFIGHIERLVTDDRLRLPTSRGRKSTVTLIRDVSFTDRGVDLKRLMSEMGKPDRQLESTMPVGKAMDVALSTKKWWIFKSPVGRFRAISLSPSRALLSGQPPAPLSASDLQDALSRTPPPLTGVPVTLAIMSTSGFTPEAKEAALKAKDRTVILISPNDTGGWGITAPPEAADMASLFDPELDLEKRSRIRAEIDANRIDLMSSGIATDKLAAKLQLAPQLIESELKSYARENPGLTAKRMDGRLVLFREGSAPLGSAAVSGGIDMPFIDRVKTLFARKGEVEKKIAFLSERRTALSQQLDRGYEDMGVMETKESELRQQFKDSTSDLPRRRITSQLVQLRKDIERRQQLLSVLNQQINVVSTHLHNLELQRQGKSASLPDSEEMAADAAAAEDVLAELQAGSELAESVGTAAHGGMSAEEQAVYEELLNDSKEPESPATAAAPPAKSSAPQGAVSPPAAANKTPPPSQRQRTEPEAG
jgi:TolA-binding protein